MSDCKCSGWADDSEQATWHRLVTGHHIHCECSPSVSAELLAVIREMVRKMEFWASLEDGIPEEAWPIYQKAKTLIKGYEK